MKKILLLAAVLVALTSCKKSYTCVCTSVMTTTSTGNPDVMETSTFEETLEPAKKKNATSDCESRTAQTSASMFGMNITTRTSCKLKD